MATSLDQILASTRAGLPALAARRRELEVRAASQPVPPSLASALRGRALALIAEVKRRSPSAGSICEELDPVARAATYARAGAAALSVLTDTAYFGGSVADLEAVAAAVPVPVLRKDFILSEDQLLEARAAGASGALLIVRALAPARLRDLLAFAGQLGLDALVEAHTASEVRGALDAGATVVGVNSRDLDTFRIDVHAAWRLLALVPAPVLAVAESGIETVADAAAARDAGADAVLVGTALSRALQPAGLVRGIASLERHGR
jgi:indole-3-glycerol phosphate synthase